MLCCTARAYKRVSNRFTLQSRLLASAKSNVNCLEAVAHNASAVAQMRNSISQEHYKRLSVCNICIICAAYGAAFANESRVLSDANAGSRSDRRIWSSAGAAPAAGRGSAAADGLRYSVPNSVMRAARVSTRRANLKLPSQQLAASCSTPGSDNASLGLRKPACPPPAGGSLKVSTRVRAP